MLPHNFLAQMARDHELSKDQEEVFLLRYRDELDYHEIAKRLKTSEGACLKRMGQVYNKFNVSGSSRGKENRLRISLTNQYQKELAKQTAKPQQISTPTPEPQKESDSDDKPINSSPSSVKEVVALSQISPKIYENLPKRECTNFIGRRQELIRLLQLLSFEKATHLISVDGVGGVGKTTLVIEAAHLCLQASITGHSEEIQTFEGTPIPTFEAIIFTCAKQQYLQALRILPRLKRERSLKDIYRTIANTLERPEIGYRPPEEQLDLIQNILKRQRTLLIVDNLETLEDKQDLLSFVYDLPPTVKVIMTTREQAWFVPVRLDSLPESDALRLINYQASEKGITLAPFEAELLYQNTYGIPAAIVYTIGQLSAGYLLADVLMKLKSATGDVARFCFEASVERLRGEPGHRILMTLSLFPQPVERVTIAAIACEDSMNTGDALALLQQLSLVQQQDGRYRLHPLTREYAAAELLNNQQFELEMRNRWVSWYRTFFQEYGDIDEKKWFTTQQNQIKTEWENLQDVMKWCRAKDRYKDILAFWRQIKGYAHVRGHWDERREWSSWLIEAADLRNDKITLAEVLCDYGWTLTLTRQPEALSTASKLLQRAWELRDYQDINFQLELANRMAAHSVHQNNFDQAHEWLKVKQYMLKKTGVSELELHRQQIQTLYYQGKMLFIAGDYVRAKKLYQKALQQSEKIAWHRLTTLIRNWLADIAIKEDNLQLAQQILEQGLRLAQLNEDKHSIAFHQRSFAFLYQQLGNMELVQYWAIQSSESFESLGMIPEARKMRELANRELGIWGIGNRE